jgi:hypothetical protein
MKIINPPTVNSLDVFGKISDSKNAPTQGILKGIYPHIKSRYSEYSNHKANLADISPSTLNTDSRTALLHCYSGETQELSRMKSEIKANYISSAGSKKCQFCGIEIISTYDHYLPKEKFPEFSVHAPNLIPCCSTCNNKKRAAFLTQLGERAIINIYYESIPNDQYLFSKIEFRNGVPVANFYLEKPSTHSECLFRLISEHYSRLDLLERYRENAPEILSETRVSIISHAHPNADDVVKTWLITESKNIANQYSINNWKVALFCAMANSDDFINGCL